MKKKIVVFACLLSLALFAAACGGNTEGNTPGETASPTEPGTAEPGGSESVPTEPAQGETPDPAAPEEIAASNFLGKWTVTGVAGAAEVSTGPDEDIVGTTAEYTEDAASFGLNKIRPPEYAVAKMTPEEFVGQYRTQPGDLGIDAETVTVIMVPDWDNPGSLLVMKDAQTILTLWDGTFYEMKRES